MLWTILLWVGAYLVCGSVFAVVVYAADELCHGSAERVLRDKDFALCAIIWPAVLVAGLLGTSCDFARAIGKKLRRKEPTE